MRSVDLALFSQWTSSLCSARCGQVILKQTAEAVLGFPQICSHRSPSVCLFLHSAKLSDLSFLEEQVVDTCGSFTDVNVYNEDIIHFRLLLYLLQHMEALGRVMT